MFAQTVIYIEFCPGNDNSQKRHVYAIFHGSQREQAKKAIRKRKYLHSSMSS